MNTLNYHHLEYFWTVAREGTVSQAAERLHLSQPTISTQLRLLERSLGVKLFAKDGRRLRLTAAGQEVLRFADEIFFLGRQLKDAVQGLPTGVPLRFAVGVPDVLPKLIVYRLLKPALAISKGAVHLSCIEGELPYLMQRLAAHELDLVLSDLPATGNPNVRLYNHKLGQCGVSFFGTPELAKRYRKSFPESLGVAPLLLPAAPGMLRRMIDQWFDEQGLAQHVAAEFSDSALLKVFGQEGLGIFPGPAVLNKEIERQYRVKELGTIEDLQESFFAISAERKIKHPAVLALAESAREELF